ncbi:hypothetical protein C7408_103134 [Paraburkholderia caballeronis]|nr:hypothetical protein C7408_103134 [Paraburkholderia caballeronis]TDV20084.1 hypothetical protein C7406_103307 [Paraburkholderia caballeronis]TDV28301.1 hypothetical protein C7404_103307 [Paraburkholderia caballeronis]TDV37009.1 hypothetical protein C7405_103135 [Paraburkholderia caballeronis]
MRATGAADAAGTLRDPLVRGRAAVRGPRCKLEHDGCLRVDPGFVVRHADGGRHSP